MKTDQFTLHTLTYFRVLWGHDQEKVPEQEVTVHMIG